MTRLLAVVPGRGVIEVKPGEMIVCDNPMDIWFFDPTEGEIHP